MYRRYFGVLYSSVKWFMACLYRLNTGFISRSKLQEDTRPEIRFDPNIQTYRVDIIDRPCMPSSTRESERKKVLFITTVKYC